MVLRGVVHSPVLAGVVHGEPVIYFLIFFKSPVITSQVVDKVVDIVTDISYRVSQLCPQGKPPLE